MKLIHELRVATVIVISILIVSPVISIHWAITDSSKPGSHSIFANSLNESLLEDPFLENEPQVVINGTSGEFSASFHASSGDADVSYEQMDWIHVENRSLDFRGVDPNEVIPDYNDFIYMYQIFEYPYEVVPTDAGISLNYSIHLTGDFVA